MIMHRPNTYAGHNSWSMVTVDEISESMRKHMYEETSTYPPETVTPRTSRTLHRRNGVPHVVQQFKAALDEDNSRQRLTAECNH